MDTAIDPIGLHHQLTLHAVIPAPRTILQGIRKLAPATTLSIDASGRETSRVYWHLRAERPKTPRRAGMARCRARCAATGGAATAGYRRCTGGRAVVRRTGFQLAGGVAGRIRGTRPATFSVGFEDQPEEKGSEFEYSDQVVARYQTRHHKYLIPNDRVLERLPEAITCMAEPMVGQDAVAFFLLAEQVSQAVKVVQSGQGADEVFGGYFWYPG